MALRVLPVASFYEVLLTYAEGLDYNIAKTSLVFIALWLLSFIKSDKTFVLKSFEAGMLDELAQAMHYAVMTKSAQKGPEGP